MGTLGYSISSEEHAAKDLVEHAQLAEKAGFTIGMISDHYHPWTDSQGHSPFVWSVLGAIASTTSSIKMITGVTCPTIRIHPAIIAQSAATIATMMPGRFCLGVGSGEKLNEHILGDRWPETDVRLEMLDEAVEVIRQLWQGGMQSHHGKHYTVENARIYSLPEEPTPIYVAAAGPTAAKLAGKSGDGLITTKPEPSVVTTFDQAGGTGKPSHVQMTVCYEENEAQALKTAMEIWPTAGVPGELSQELPTPAHFEQVAQLVTEQTLAESIVCGPDPEKHLEKINKAFDAGFDFVHVHQVGPNQAGMINFYKEKIFPRL